MVRVDVQIPDGVARDSLKSLAIRLREAAKRAGIPNPHLDLVLGTINAPRSTPIDGPTLILCLLAPHAIPAWRPHIEALFDEVSPEAIHRVVLSGIIGFEDLHRAARTWRMTDARNTGWVREMADYSLARPAAFGHRTD